VTPLKAIDRFTSLTIIGMTKIMCNRSHCIYYRHKLFHISILNTINVSIRIGYNVHDMIGNDG
jgi:hypothetical protein